MKISRHAYEELLKAEIVQRDLYKKISVARGYFDEEVSEERTEPVSFKEDEPLLVDKPISEFISYADYVYQSKSERYFFDTFLVQGLVEKKGLYKQVVSQRLKLDEVFRENYFLEMEKHFYILKGLSDGNIIGEFRRPSLDKL
jgi:hypothetical protein